MAILKYTYAKVIKILAQNDIIVKTKNNMTIDLRLAEVKPKELDVKEGKKTLRLFLKLIPINSTIYYKIIGKNYNRIITQIKSNGKLFNPNYNNILKKKELYGVRLK